MMKQTAASMIATIFLGACTLGATAEDVAGSNIAKDRLGCQIRAASEGGSLLIEGIVRSPVAASGDYRFTVSSRGPAGRADIRQGGEFAARAGEEVVVGRLKQGSPGATHEARLEVTVKGKTVTCKETIGPRV
jgi:hypothetical protein